MSLVFLGVVVGQRPIANDGWQRWWKFNKAPFLNLKESIHDAGVVIESDDFIQGWPLTGSALRESRTMKPTKATIVNRILPTLKIALDRTTNRDIKSSCILAMAKIGKDHPDFKILEVFKQHLHSKDSKIRETAVLAMGISQMPDAVGDLIALATDSRKGRSLTDRSEVDGRSRCFAAYGLGLIANRTSKFSIKDSIFTALKALIESNGHLDSNLRAAAINGMSLLNPSLKDTNSRLLLADCLDTLEAYYFRDPVGGEQQIKAHVPPAIAKLLLFVEDGELAKRKDQFKRLFLDQLRSGSMFKHSAPQITQSCALALGQLVRLHDESSKTIDDRSSNALFDYYKTGEDEQARHFSLLALGQIGGSKNRDALLRALEKGSEATKPWAAIALGLYAFRVSQSEPDAAPDEVIGSALVHGFHRAEAQSTKAAFVLALGLAKYQSDDVDMRDMLRGKEYSDQLKGYMCSGLALMNDQRSIEDLTNIVKASIRHPERLNQAAIALAKLGDKKVSDLLQDMMVYYAGENPERMSSIASTLGQIGDRRHVDPFTKMLLDESLTVESRRAAATALGNIADKEMLPWNSKIAVGINYRAAVGALTNGSTGILDIL